MEVLGGLGAGDEVIVRSQGGGVGLKQGVIERDPMPLLPQHLSQCRTRSAAVVEPLRCGRQALEQRLGESAQEASVAGVGGVVVMLAVVAQFRLW